MSTLLTREPLESVYTVAERVLGSRPSPQVIHRWRRKGLRGVKLPARTFGPVSRITESEFRAWIDRVSEAAGDGL